MWHLKAEGKNLLLRLNISKIQAALLAIASTSILLLGYSSLVELKMTNQNTQVLSDIETPAASVIFTQRETLVYATQLALWSNGGTSRRNVQIARNLLAQRLRVIDSSGVDMGSRASSAYWQALKQSDAIVSESPIGVLPEYLHEETNARLIPVIDLILDEARNLVVSYQRSIDAEMLELAKRRAEHDLRSLILFYLFFTSGGLFLVLNIRGNLQKLRRAKLDIARERELLEEAEFELQHSQNRILQLQDLDSAKNSLISNVNHELRTPLTSIIGYIELLQREMKADISLRFDDYLEVLERNAHILLRLVESLLSLSKFDNAIGELPDLEVSLNKVIEDAIYMMKPVIEESNIEILLSLEDDLKVKGDEGQLSQVFVNLISNAIKFSPSGSTITIRAKSHQSEDGVESARISVIDEGIGILMEDIPYLFTRFYRASNIKSDTHQGFGLGLAIVKEVITRHGGEISVLSQLNSGSEFILTIPTITGGNDG